MKLLKKILLSFFLCIGGCGSENKNTIGQPWEEYSSYEDGGFNEKKLNELTKFIEEKSNTSGLVVISNGKKIYQYGDIEDISYIAVSYTHLRAHETR